MLEGKRIALDCANGAMSSIAPQVFERLGASVEIVGNDPSGDNINDGVGSECPEAMVKLISSGEFDMGFAFDGDGDRVIAFDQRVRSWLARRHWVSLLSRLIAVSGRRAYW